MESIIGSLITGVLALVGAIITVNNGNRKNEKSTKHTTGCNRH